MHQEKRFNVGQATGWSTHLLFSRLCVSVLAFIAFSGWKNVQHGQIKSLLVGFSDSPQLF